MVGVLVLMLLNAWTQVITPALLGQATDCYLTPAVVSCTPALMRADAVVGAAQGEATPGTLDVAASRQQCWFGQPPPGSPTSDYIAGLGWLVLILVGIFIVGAISGGLTFYLMGWAGQHVLRRLQVEVFDHLQDLTLSYYSEHETGDLMSRITNDISTIQQAISFALVQVVSGVVILVWIGWSMLRLNWAYALLSLAVVPVMIVATLWFSGQARRAFRRTRKEIGNVNAELQESISGVRETQAFSREEANIESFRVSNAANRDANLRAVAYTSALAPTLEGLGYVATALVAGVGGILLLRGSPSPGRSSPSASS